MRLSRIEEHKELNRKAPLGILEWTNFKIEINQLKNGAFESNSLWCFVSWFVGRFQAAEQIYHGHFVFRVKVLVCGTIATVLTGYILRKIYIKKKQERVERNLKLSLEKSRRERRARSRVPSATLQDEQKCVVCVENPKEVSRFVKQHSENHLNKILYRFRWFACRAVTCACVRTVPKKLDCLVQFVEPKLTQSQRHSYLKSHSQNCKCDTLANNRIKCYMFLPSVDKWHLFSIEKNRSNLNFHLTLRPFPIP